MLTNLVIRNYALIEALELQPNLAFNVITGETGAGKSIMLGAMGLLLGNRADRKVLFNENEKCVVEATFDVSEHNLQAFFEENELDYDPHTVIRREIAATSGKSRAFINDTPVTLEVLGNLSKNLLDIHSQHDTLMLAEQLYQLQLIDAYAQIQLQVTDYQRSFYAYKKAQQYYQKLLTENEVYQKEFDYNKFLFDELQKANLKIGEQEILEQELEGLENAEEIKSKLNEALNQLSHGEHSVVFALKSAVKILEKLVKYAPQCQSLAERLEVSRIEIKDVTDELEDTYENTEHDPEAIQEIYDRLQELTHLTKKHKVNDLKALLEIEKELKTKVERVLNFDEEIENHKQTTEKQYQNVKNIAKSISEKRKSVANLIEKDLANLFAEVGMTNATLKIQIYNTEPTQTGTDKVSFLFSANKGIAPQEIKNVASGGEFSRLMLCMKYILAGKTSLPTLIFDEVDTGISGEVALKVGKMMKEMAEKHQIIAITHLHQIAAQGNSHYFVFKEDTQDRTYSRMKQLSDKERIIEIAKMISGSEPSETALKSAEELLQGGGV